MESYEVLQNAIPQKASGRVAQLLSVSADYVRRWRREPDSDESPTASGQRSILDRICDLVDVVFLVNPSGAGLIINYINAHYAGLMERHAKPIVGHASTADTIEELLVQTTQAINSLNKYGCTDRTLRELVEMRDAASMAINRVQITMNAEENNNV